MSDSFFMAMIVIAIVCASLAQAFALNGLVLASAGTLAIGAVCVYAIR